MNGGRESAEGGWGQIGKHLKCVGKAQGCFLGSLGGTCFLSHSRLHYTVKMGDRSILKEVTSVVVPIQKVIVHPRFSAAGTIRNDLALLWLLYPVNFTVAIQPIYIPKKTLKVEAGTRCWVTGWGKKQYGETVRQEANLGRGR